MKNLRATPAGVLMTGERLLGMKQVDASNGTPLNYGTVAKPITVVSVEAALDAHKVELDAYNSAKVELATLLTKLKKAEKIITTMGVQVLSGAKGFFTPDGEEVQALGGTRTSDRKSPKKKPVIDLAEFKKAS